MISLQQSGREHVVSEYKSRIHFSRLNARTPYQDLMVQAAGRRLLSAQNLSNHCH